MPESNFTLVPARSTRRRLLGQLAGTAAAIGWGLPALAAPARLRIGSTLDHSSVEKANGSGLHIGASAYFAALNKAGGINGMPVELVLSDDQFKPELAKANAAAFDADRSIVAMLHPLGTRQAAAVMETVKDMAVVGPNTGTTGLRKTGSTNTFWVRANYDQEIEKLVSTAASVGIRHIGMVRPKDALGDSLLAAFTAATAKFKLEPGTIATTPNTISLEVEPAARELAKSPPQVVIMGLAGTAPAFVRALRAAGCTSTLYGLSITASAANIQELGDGARGLGFSLVVPSPFAGKYEIVRRYQADMQASGSTAYSLPSLEGYINARVLAEGLRRAGANPTRESVLAALGGVEALDLGGLRIDFSRGRREGGNFVDVAIVGQGGRILI